MPPTDAIRAWTPEEWDLLERTALIRVAGERRDGSLRPLALVGHVRVGEDVLIRSLNGPDGAWYRGAVATGRGVIEVAGARIRVAFHADRGREDDVDDALRARYGTDSGVRQMTRSPARDATLRVLPLS